MLYFLSLQFFGESLDISDESSAKQTIDIKCQDLFSLKQMEKKQQMSSAAVVIGALNVGANSFFLCQIPI